MIIEQEEAKEDTLDISWLTEEESMIQLNSCLEKELLLHIELRVFFVDTQFSMREMSPRKLKLDISGNGSILPKESIIQEIETAKQEYTELYTSSGVFTLMDVLIWNIAMDATRIHLMREFEHGSLFSDIVLAPSLSIFHSEQCIFIFLRECCKSSVSSKSKQTKRVRFHTPAYKNTRKVLER